MLSLSQVLWLRHGFLYSEFLLDFSVNLVLLLHLVLKTTIAVSITVFISSYLGFPTRQSSIQERVDLLEDIYSLTTPGTTRELFQHPANTVGQSTTQATQCFHTAQVQIAEHLEACASTTDS